MADIKKFRAIRPADVLAEKTAALPYDVYDRGEARAEALSHPDSFLNIDRPETQFPKDHDMYAPDVYRKADDMIRERIRERRFLQDPEDLYYLYELTMNGRTQTGIVACASIDDYLSGVIRKHENTREDKLQDRIRHVDVCGMQTGPIFLAYRADDTIRRITDAVRQETPLFDFTSADGIRHRGWKISAAEDQEAIRCAFAQMNEIYIADGHHRAESAVRAGLMRRERHPDYSGKEEFNYFLSVLFPDDELMIMDYNRVMHDLAGMNCGEVLAKLETVFTMEPCERDDAPSEKGKVQMYLDGQWYMGTFRQEVRSSDPVRGLDVSVLQDHVLEPFFGIQDPKTDSRIEFVGGIRGAAELERRADHFRSIAFRMYPTSIRELMDVADAGLLMPPKSTWFEPKLRSGLFLHEIGH